jgi:hypothetical protein
MLTNALPRYEHFSAFASREATSSAILAALPRGPAILDHRGIIVRENEARTRLLCLRLQRESSARRWPGCQGRGARGGGARGGGAYMNLCSCPRRPRCAPTPSASCNERRLCGVQAIGLDSDAAPRNALDDER